MVHHGGAGTTAAGLRYGKPTLVCPFFGDQFFWGEMVSRSGAGPAACPVFKLTPDLLTAKFEELTSEEVRLKAGELQARMAREDGVSAGYAPHAQISRARERRPTRPMLRSVISFAVTAQHLPCLAGTRTW